MELHEWILANMRTRLLLRMKLYPQRGYSHGAEAVLANLVACTPGGMPQMMLNVTYECHSGASLGSLTVITRSDVNEFGAMARAIASMWENEHNWDEREEQVVTARLPRWRVLPIANVTVLQALQRVLGAYGSAVHEDPEVDCRRVVADRLQSAIQQGNFRLQELIEFA